MEERMKKEAKNYEKNIVQVKMKISFEPDHRNNRKFLSIMVLWRKKNTTQKKEFENNSSEVYICISRKIEIDETAAKDWMEMLKVKNKKRRKQKIEKSIKKRTKNERTNKEKPKNY